MRQLVAAGYHFVALDHRSTGHQWAVAPEAVLVVGNAGEQALAGALIKEHAVGTVAHFAGSIVVPESMVEDVAASPARRGFRNVILRYFNVAGAGLDGTLGQATENATHLSKVACEAACGIREKVTVSKRTIRLRTGLASGIAFTWRISLARTWMRCATWKRAVRRKTFNCGYGRGYSAREVLRMVEKVSGMKLRIEEGPRRAGDALELVAQSSKIRLALSWHARHDELELICSSAQQGDAKARTGSPGRGMRVSG